MIVVITNRKAGTGAGERESEIHEAFGGTDGVEVLVVDGPAIRDAAMAAVERGATIIVAAGGDGTVSAVASAVVNTAAALGVLPMGTLNHFAKDAGIPLELAEAAELVTTGIPQPVDVATLNDEVFINNSSIGAYPVMVRDRNSQQSRFKRSRWWAMIRASIATFQKFPLFGVRMTVEGNEQHLRTPAVVVGNNVYALDAYSLGTRARLDAGVVSVHTVHTRTRWEAIRLLLFALFRGFKDHELFDVTTTDELWLECDHQTLDVSMDGEVSRMQTPLHYRVMPAALRVIMPPRAS